MPPFQLYEKTGQKALPTRSFNERLHDPKLYRPSDGLVHAVNVALALGQPLLLTGEPGTGKTQLAWHIADFFGLGDPITFNAQTSSSARDLFYHYNALGHFQYAQTQKEPLTLELVEERFIRYEALGRAIVAGTPKVVLLDEIDKAPRDLPNDVLAALEDLRFKVPELDNKPWPPDYKRLPDARRPIIIMTSNSEKNLPDPFLRRVVYHHIPFPGHAELLHILNSKVNAPDAPGVATPVRNLNNRELKAIVDHFELLRNEAEIKLRKKPATAELIYWADLLRQMNFPIERLNDLEDLHADEQHQLLRSYAALAKTREDHVDLKKWLTE